MHKAVDKEIGRKITVGKCVVARLLFSNFKANNYFPTLFASLIGKYVWSITLLTKRFIKMYRTRLPYVHE